MDLQMTKVKNGSARAVGKTAPCADKIVRPAKTGQSSGLAPASRNTAGQTAARARTMRNADISELARKYTARAIERIAEIMESDNNREALAAAFHLLDRAFPKNASGSDDKNSTNEVMLGLRESLRAKLARLTE
jgi:hypothetical protein